MAESEGIQAIVKQVAIQAATTVMIVLSDADVRPKPTNDTASPRDHRDRDMVDHPLRSFHSNGMPKTSI